jgi:pimeloyl-ACP methyl ester carboxylesterase
MAFGVRSMRTSVVSRGFNISYRSEGSGDPVLLLQGWSRQADDWWDQGYVEALAEEYRVVAVDRLGHGQSDKPHDPALYLEEVIVSDLVAVLDAERIERLLVWGFSMGATNAASLAVSHPGRVAALVCGGTVPLPSTEERRLRTVSTAELVSTVDGFEFVLRSIGTPEEGLRESVAHNDLAALSACMRASAEWFPSAADVRAPMLWYFGTDDQGGFAPEELELAERLGVETFTVAGANHVMSFRLAQEVLQSVRPFLDQHRS